MRAVGLRGATGSCSRSRLVGPSPALSLMDSSILFAAEIVNPRLIKVAYTRLNFVERGFIPLLKNFFSKVL